MISSILLENFQSHEKTKLIFSPGVNSIIGSSDRGKTVILRSLRKVSHNKPGGTAFRSNWGGDTLIKVETDDEVAVSRLVTDKDNKYFLDTPNLTEEFKAFGQGVPDEITQALNMDDENIQSQMDAPFLFSASDGEVARRLNEAANLKKIDRSQSFLDKRIRACKADLKQNKIDLKKHKEDLSKTDFIEDADKELNKLETLEKDYKEKEQSVGDLDYLLTQIEESNKTIEKLDFLKKATELYNSLVKLSTECSDQGTSIEELKELTDELNDIDDSLKNSIDPIKAHKEIDLLLSYNEGVEEKQKSINELSELLGQLKTISEEAEELKEEEVESQEEFDKLMPDVCPLCGDRDEG